MEKDIDHDNNDYWEQELKWSIEKQHNKAVQ